MKTQRRYTERQIERVLSRLLSHWKRTSSIRTFEESGVLTRDNGVRARLDNGQTLYLTIQLQKS